MSRSRDFQIGWVVLFAMIFWVSIWQHDVVAKAWRTASTAALNMASAIMPSQPHQPAATPNPPKRSSGRTPSKQQ